MQTQHMSNQMLTISSDYKNRADLTCGLWRCYTRFRVTDKNTHMYRWDALSVARIPLLDFMGSGTRFIEERAIRFLLESSPKESLGDQGFRRKECRDMEGFAVP
jgi:hypothetical protein